LHLDVFTDRPFSGNQLAVFPQAAGLDSEVMQRIAAEIGFAETTFVLPAEGAGTHARVRIFTPGVELPMAGHPTIGTTFALALERSIEAGREEIVLGLGVGPTRVQLEWEAGRLRFAWMTQPEPKFGSKASGVSRLAHALGIGDEEIRNPTLPAQELSSGVPFLFVPLRSRKAVDAVVVDRAALSDFYRAEGIPEMPVYVFSLEPAGDDADIYSRMFAPGFGVVEDPATGGAGGPLGAYLVHYRAVSADRAAHMINLQGVKMGRPSRIHISIGTRQGQIESARVGGLAVLVAEGAMHL